MTPLYRELALRIDARQHCIAHKNKAWKEKHEDAILDLVKAYMPSGSGFDSGTAIDFTKSTGEKLVFTTAFHHMDEDGYYTEWTHHEVRVRPSLSHDFDLSITGRNVNDIKEFMYDSFIHALQTKVEISEE